MVDDALGAERLEGELELPDGLSLQQVRLRLQQELRAYLDERLPDREGPDPVALLWDADQCSSPQDRKRVPVQVPVGNVGLPLSVCLRCGCRQHFSLFVPRTRLYMN